MGASKTSARLDSCAASARRPEEHGYVLILAMLILTAMGMAAATLLTQVLTNQQHVTRDRAYTQSLAVAEAGLNQYLWMVASGTSSQSNGFAIAGNTGPDPHFKQFNLTDIYTDSVKGTYAIQVTPPTAQDSRVLVTVTGQATSPADVPRTVTAHLGRPSFCEYVLLTNEEVWIGGPLDRVWHGKTHSNTGICIDTANITDPITSANATYSSSMFGGTHTGVWSGYQYYGAFERSVAGAVEIPGAGHQLHHRHLGLRSFERPCRRQRSQPPLLHELLRTIRPRAGTSSCSPNSSTRSSGSPGRSETTSGYGGRAQRW